MDGRFIIGKAPHALSEGAERARRISVTERRKWLKREAANTRFRYYCSLCLIIRDESEYLEEWLKWHIAQGVEHFYIYDHGSRHPVSGFVRSLGGEIAERTEVIDWSGSHKDAQPDAYNDCLRRARGVSRWVGFIDADEHVRVKDGRNLPEFLEDYEEYAGLFAIWVTYGADGRVKKSDEPLRERFTKVSHGDTWAENVGKLIAQPLYMAEMVIHNGRAEEGFEVVDEHRRRLKEYILTMEKPTRDYICVDHYYTKSHEEWIAKLKRGSSHVKFSRRYNDFFMVNPDMEYCRENIDILQAYEKFD